MRKLILTYGTLSGAIIIGSVILGLAVGDGGSQMAAMEWLGYLIMIVALSMIFVGIKRYRDETLGGVIKFGTAFKLGLGISVVASVIYVAAWEVNLALTDYAFIHDYAASVIEAKQAEGATGAELLATEADMAAMTANYANPLYRLPVTFSEIFPVGLLITLVSAGLLQNSRLMPARRTAVA